ncbi:GNAT family N-acetyltransferase [Chelatococcus sp. GCM10030263]|uniref:GNAT family N-acetyltransferase n=1 Tax=Chelatococcus sp. GCM10030263 TaxID=3273387 RepID=UPI003614296C
MQAAAGPRPARGAPARAPLDGRSCRLEPLDAARHGDSLWAAVAGHDHLWDYMPYGPFPNPADFRTFLTQRASLDDPLTYAVVDRTSERALGWLALMEIRPQHGVIEVGHVLFSPGLQRTPIATEAVALLAAYAFDDLGYRRFEWKCNTLNAPSQRAALRFGFVFEGVFHQHMIVKGRNRDTAWFSMLDGEWPARRAAFAQWLDPDNFDAEGRQKTSLASLNRDALSARVRLRRAGEADREALVALQHAAFVGNRDVLGVEPLPLREDYDAVLARDEVWLAEDRDIPVGALILTLRPDDLYIASVGTLPTFRGRGLGKRLLGFAENRAEASGRSVLRLCTGKKLTKNIAWYARNGYVIEREEQLADRIIVHMMKGLATA